jgi:hypothetical protein
MTQDEMIELARQAGFAEPERIISTDTVRCVPDLAYFAELVAAKERERMTVVAMNAAEKAVDVAIKLEREACAVDADWCIQNHLEQHIPERIRARKQV